MEVASFLKNYIKYPRMIGAICPSSKALANKMMEKINFENARCIVEYGPGTGVFTEELIKRKKKDTVLFVMELNDDLYDLLKFKYGHTKNVYIIHDSAEKVNKYINRFGFEYVDYIVSGLPFAAFPEDLSNDILTNTVKLLKKDGKFITFQYTLLKRNLMRKFFQEVSIAYEFRNIPPAFVFNCGRQEVE
ncbi:class I SAM-dependent methyltransferase [Crassaminicella profunda]|uniref:class I SAM-dependent methyltransferase n=1 Tax=Crassaminicella profunda TaxID=1286698 RepID=UPI001CA75D35|nr:rRNA adenine N-6-methyltransferase family protein [Crassaminicella profunda]QZY53854.1 SAM-dependent methyltransferase [Crassaminicella profunda]